MFEREIKIHLEERNGLFKIKSILHDTAHDMSVMLDVDPKTMEIKEAAAQIERAPYAICQQSVQSIKSLIGLKIKAGINRQAKELAGGTQGCVHLIELAQECFKAAYQGQIRLIVTNLTGDDRTKKLEELLWGQCLRYTQHYASMDLLQAQ